MKIDKKEFDLRNHPVIITPYDDIVDKAYHEIYPRPEVDVIKLEPSCSGNKIAWVSNKDLLTGRSGQQRVIHLCLNKIKDQYKKQYGKSLSVEDPQQRQKFKEIIKDQLKYIVIPHEMKHIEQELTHGGQFPTSAEPEAERAEKRKELQTKYLHKKATVEKVLDNYFKGVQSGMAYKVPEEEVSKEDLAKQTSTVEKLVKDIITSKLPEYKEKVYSVGGFVRDRLLGNNPKDLDLVVDDPEREMEAAKDFANKLVDALGIRSANNPHPLKEAYGIWGVALLNPKKDNKREPFKYDGVDVNGYVLELTPPRKEGPYDIKNRAPSYVKYTPLEDDSKRRDLTINALYQNIVTGKIKDYVGGLDDLKNKKLKPPEHPEGARKIYEDDPLRILRLIRFKGKLPDFEIDPETEKEIKKFISDPEGHKIISDKLSKERVQEEFNKILTNPSASKVVDGLELMKSIGMLKYLSPELEKLYDLYHDNVYHRGESVWQHTMDVVGKTPATLKARLAAFFHDIGKIYTKKEDVDKEGRPRVHFKEHEKHSAVMVEKILKDLKYSGDIISSIKDIVHSHMGFKDFENQKPATQNRAMRVFIEKLHNDLEDAITLLKADTKTENVGKIEKLEQSIKNLIEEDKKKGIFVETKKGYKYKVPLSGDDLMSAYNLEGEAIGAVISYLKKFMFEGRMGDPDLSKRKEEAIKLVNALMKDKAALKSAIEKYSENKQSDNFFSIKKASISKVLLKYVDINKNAL
jgi:tRNA nucleotidyltransferase (CCA-adding enzyme)